MELRIPIKEGSKTKAVLKLLNPFLSNLTETELNITSMMIDMDIDFLDRDNRTRLRTNLDMSKYLFNNYLQSLKGKKILINDNHNIPVLNSNLKSLVSNDNFNISFSTINEK